MLYEQRNRLARSILLPMLLLILSMGVVVACAQNAASNSSTPTSAPTTAPTSQPSIPAITIKAMDFSYDLPQTVPAGLVDITLANSGTELHQAQLVQLNTGVTFDQFHSALLQKGLLVMRTLGTLMGGPNITAPGQSTEVILKSSRRAVCSAMPHSGKRWGASIPQRDDHLVHGDSALQCRPSSGTHWHWTGCTEELQHWSAWNHCSWFNHLASDECRPGGI